MKRANKTLLGGLLFGVLLLFSAIAMEIKGSSPAVFIHPVAVVIVFGGITAAAMIQLPGKELKRVALRTYYAVSRPKDNFIPTLREIVKISVNLNRDLMYLEKAENLTENTMLADALKLISMGFKAEEIRRFLENKREQNSAAYLACYNLFSNLAKMGPAFGLVGTLIGLIILLYYHMGSGDMGRVASSMGIALTATLYGVGISNLVLAPIAEYMMYTAEKNELLDELIIQGSILLKERKHPLYLVQALKAYIPREDYDSIDSIVRQELAGSDAPKTEKMKPEKTNAATKENEQPEKAAGGKAA